MKVPVIITLAGVILSGSGWLAANTISKINDLDEKIEAVKAQNAEDMKYIIDRIDKRLDLTEDRIMSYLSKRGLM